MLWGGGGRRCHLDPVCRSALTFCAARVVFFFSLSFEFQCQDAAQDYVDRLVCMCVFGRVYGRVFGRVFGCA